MLILYSVYLPIQVEKTGTIYDDLWIEVDFLENKHVTAVATQGRANYDQWVTEYQVMFKKDGQNAFTTVEDENNQPKVSVVTVIHCCYNIFCRCTRPKRLQLKCVLNEVLSNQ